MHTLTVRVASIIQAESDADKLEADASALRWTAAELIAQELADGKTQRQLAEEIGKSHVHVNHMNATWLGNLGYRPDERPPFNQAYQEAKKGKAQARPSGPSSSQGSPKEEVKEAFQDLGEAEPEEDEATGDFDGDASFANVEAHFLKLFRIMFGGSADKKAFKARLIRLVEEACK